MSESVDAVSLNLESQLCFALYSATHRIQALYRRPLKDLGLTYVQYLVMLALREQDERSVSEIGEQLALDSATVTPVLKRMERGGFIERQRSSQDERRVIAKLTSHGHTIMAKVEEVAMAVSCTATEASEDVSALLVSLHQLRDNLPDAIS